jgi:cobalt-zinc-cadmium efflux system outer membrane protein
MFLFLPSFRWREATLAVALLAGAVPRGAASETTNPTGPITLRDALGLALAQSPDLASFAWETRARDARLLQAGRLTNPSLNVLAEDLGLGAPAANALAAIQRQTTIQLSQLVELGGKRGARRGVATAQRDLAAMDYEAARLDLLTRVAESFVDVISSQGAAALARDTLEITQRLHEAVSARVAAGVVSPLEETKSGVGLALARIEAAKAGRSLETHRAQLAAFWGTREALFERADGDLAILPAPPPITDLRALLAKNPDLARWASEVAEREAASAFERSKRWPDLTLTAGYRRFAETSDRAWLVGASIPLPIFDRNRDGVEEARSRLNKARDEQRAAEARLNAALVAAHNAVTGAFDEVSAIEATVLPGAQSAFDGTEEGYREGKFSLLDLLDTQRSLVNAKTQRLRGLGDLHKASARLERLIARPLVEGPPSSLQIP